MLLYLAFRRVGEALLIISSDRLRWWAASGCCGGWAFIFPGDGHRFYCPCRGRRRIWRGELMYLRHAIEAEPSLNNPQTSASRSWMRRYITARYCACAQSDDGGGDYRWSAADSVGNRRGSEVMSRIAAPMIGGMITALCCRCLLSRRRIS